jgi:hypothetical protein
MMEESAVNELGVGERVLLRGIVTDADDESRCVVRVGRGEDEWLVVADLLVTSATPVRLRPGQQVLCAIDHDDRERGYILGRIGPAAPSSADVVVPGREPATAVAPDTLVLEAKHSLTLRVGDGSITIRDGKILIKGKDLVSHAQRTNRIKGGSVAIN